MSDEQRTNRAREHSPAFPQTCLDSACRSWSSLGRAEQLSITPAPLQSSSFSKLPSFVFFNQRRKKKMQAIKQPLLVK